MKSNYFKKVSGLILALGFLIATPALGLAQQGYPNYNYGRPGYGYNNDNNRSFAQSMARFKGYRQGFKQGREERYARYRYGNGYGYGNFPSGYWNSQSYRNNYEGWNGDSRFGGYYDQIYRQAFQLGYRDAISGRPYRRDFGDNPSRYDR